MFRLITVLALFVAFGFSCACKTSANEPEMTLHQEYQDDTIAYRIYTMSDSPSFIRYYALFCTFECRPRIKLYSLTSMSRATIAATKGMMEAEGEVMVTNSANTPPTAEEVRVAITYARSVMAEHVRRKLSRELPAPQVQH